MFKLDKKTKHYIFNNIANGCKHNNFDYVTSFDQDNYINGIKITHNKVTYNISDIGVMGVSLLVKEDYNNVSSLWGIKKLFDFIKNNNAKSAMETKIYTSKNQYNYSVKQLIIDFNNKTYELRYGGQCRIAKKNSTTKAINGKVEELKAMGFKEITTS